MLRFCNRVVMASHYKVYELINGVQEVKQYTACSDVSTETNSKPYGPTAPWERKSQMFVCHALQWISWNLA